MFCGSHLWRSLQKLRTQGFRIQPSCPLESYSLSLLPAAPQGLRVQAGLLVKPPLSIRFLFGENLFNLDFFASCVSFLGLPGQLITNWGTKSNRNLFLYSSGSQKSTIRVLAEVFPSGASERRICAMLLASFQRQPAALGSPWQCLACSCVSPVSPSVVTWPSFLCVSLLVCFKCPSYKNTSHWI